MTDDAFIQSFFTWAVLRSPDATETTFWDDQLRRGYAHSQSALILAAVELGKTLFESAEYAGRNRDNHWYVYDLYKTYLMRDPDAGGWAAWEGLVPSIGRESVRRGFEDSGEFANLMATMTPNGGVSSNPASLITARVDPRNQAANGMLTRDAVWSLPIVTLPGRSGLDLGLALSYSSMVWTRSGPYIHFDEDNGFPSAGFRLDFPTLQRRVFDAQTNANSHLLITSAGHRVELRQVGASSVYEAGDSSYLQLTDGAAWQKVLRSTDGTQMTYQEFNNEWRCIQVKDRNGNYLTVNRNGLGQITTIIDTLGRTITFNYDTNANLTSITQVWNGQTFTWATFGWGTQNVQPSFGTLRVVGIASGATIPVITQVNLADGSRYNFEYNTSGQASVIRKYRSDNVQSLYTVYQYESTTTDCPRLSQARVWAENWTGINGVPAEVTTYFAVDGDGACRMTAPDGTIYKEYYGTGWQKGLTTVSEVWSGGVKQKWTTTAWTQDNTAVSYEMNPRVTETNTYDPSGNRRRVVTDYGGYAQWGLPYVVKEYAADGVTEIRHTYTDYNLSQPYLDKRIIGLVSEVHLTNISSYQGKIVYSYDNPSQLQSLPAAAIQHDAAYSTSFTTRGNVTAVARWDVTDITNPAKALTKPLRYNTTGAVTATIDELGHESGVSYTDSFSDNVNRNTFAYPTTLTDADNFSSSAKYNFDFGGKTRMEGPPPAGQSQGGIQTITYDTIGRVERTTTVNNSAYTRYVYGPNYVQSFSTVNNVADEAYSIQVFDAVGRVMLDGANHPDSSGGYRGVWTQYDLMGRVVRKSNPTEINAGWITYGDDSAGWVFIFTPSYDWKGRVLTTYNQDGTYSTAQYSGCGCAGGEVVTLTDEGTWIDFASTTKKRQQKIYSDVLGRIWKTEIMNWDGNGPYGTGPNNSVYSTAITSYNVRDQVTSVKLYQGTEASGVFQETTTTFDGYGRTKTRHIPIENSGVYTTWNYNADDTVQSVVDPRGATTTFGYNNRHLTTSASYSAPAGINVPGPISYNYDAAGNRSSMTDGVGSLTYHYDSLSRLDWEERTFTGLAGTYRLTYGYNLANELTSVAEPSQFGVTTSYVYDAVGRLTSVNGSGPGSMPQYMSGIQYRAWGATKHINYGSGAALDVTYNARLLPLYYSINPVYRWTYPPGYTTMGTENQYHPDGRIRYARDLQDGTFDRSYFYDHATRLQSAYSGREARGFPPSGYSDCPFQQTFTYDTWSNMGRTGHLWAGPAGDMPSYNNNGRRSDWAYDAAGNVLTRQYGWINHSHNAAGQENLYDESGFAPTETGYYYYQNLINITYNGDDEAGKRVETRYSETEEGPQNNSVETTHYVRSTALGGVAVVGVNEWGGKSEGHVYAGGQKLTDTDQSGIRIVNPVTGTWMSSYSGGGVISGTRTELDPLGSIVGETNPYVSGGSYEQLIGLESLYEERGNPFDLAGGCALDGLPISCSEFRMRMQGGSIVLESRTGDGSGWETRQEPIRNEGVGIFTTNFYFMTRSELRAHPFVIKVSESSNLSDCAKYVDGLIHHSRLNQKSGKANIGRGLLSRIPNDQKEKEKKYNNASVTGFKNRLVNQQNGWVYGHIDGIAGGTLIGKHPIGLWGQTGNELVESQIATDRAELNTALLQQSLGFPEVDHYGVWRDVDDVVAERRAEVADDEAGLEVGSILGAAVDRKMSFDDARKRIFDLLCVW